jgi:hypothetical protein
MAVNQTIICNQALARLTQGKIQSIDELNSKGAEFCKLFYDTSRQYLLRASNWGFAKKVDALALTTETPFDWDYEYQIPSGCLRVRYLAPEGGTNLTQQFIDGEMVYAPDPSHPEPVAYDIVGDKIWTNLEDAYCIYTQDVTDETKFDALFVDLLAWRLAFDVAMPLTGKHVLRDKMKAEYLEAMVKATAVNNNERQTMRRDAASQSDLVRSRR